jgi:hypothetical protein
MLSGDAFGLTYCSNRTAVGKSGVRRVQIDNRDCRVSVDDCLVVDVLTQSEV